MIWCWYCGPDSFFVTPRYVAGQFISLQSAAYQSYGAFKFEYGGGRKVKTQNEYLIVIQISQNHCG